MQAFLKYQIAEAGLGSGDTLLVAVSGGVDSVVLLHLLSELAAQFDFQLQVAHLDHQIRLESSTDADFVRRLCEDLNISCVIEGCDVTALAKSERLSLEMAGRQARREFLLRLADQVDARLIALAHHRDDQVETFMLRLLRGSGVAGLAAMQGQRDRWWRPLLERSREQILEYARLNGLEWVEDQSNSDPAFLRNRLRHQLLPQFREINPQIDEGLGELCRQLQVDEGYWQQKIAESLPRIIVSSENGLRLDRQKLLSFPDALRVRLIREALRQVRGDLQRLESVHLSAVDELLRGERSQAQLDLPACWVARRYEVLWLRKQAVVPMPDYDLLLSVPGELELPCGRTLRAQLNAGTGSESAVVAEFLWAEIDAPLRVRNWRAGDSFAPQGMAGSKKLKRLFGDQKIELEERSRAPLLVSGEQVLWVAGLRRSDYASTCRESSNVLRLELF